MVSGIFKTLVVLALTGLLLHTAAARVRFDFKSGGQTGLSRPGAGEASELSVLRTNSAPSIH